MFYVKIHQIDKTRILVAACDKDLKGKKFSENRLQLDLTSSFYSGELMDAAHLKPILRRCYSFNLVGDDVVSIAVAEKITSEKYIKKIKNIPYVQGLLVDDAQ